MKKHTSLHLLVKLGHVVRTNAPQKLDVIIAVKFCHLLLCCFVWTLHTINMSLKYTVTLTMLVLLCCWLVMVIGRAYDTACKNYCHNLKQEAQLLL